MAEQSGTIAATSSVPIRGLMPSGVVWRHLRRFVRRKPLGAFGAAIALILVVVAVFAPFIATHDPAETNGALVYAPPGSQLLLGGDQLGRDVFSRLVYGARISLYAGLLSAFIGATIGGYIGWWAFEWAGIMTAFIVSTIASDWTCHPGRASRMPYARLSVSMVALMAAALLHNAPSAPNVTRPVWPLFVII